MDAVEYLKARARMIRIDKGGHCNWNCKTCPISINNNGRELGCADFQNKYPEEAVVIVEKWAEEHPIKTRQSEFLKMFQNAKKTDDNFLTICPLSVDVNLTKRCVRYSTSSEVGACYRCRKDFWLAELPEEVEE